MVRLLLRLAIPALAAAAVLEAAPLYGMLTASSRISPALERELRSGAPAYSVVVELGFPPEYYHIHALQEIGTVAGVSDDHVRVLQLSADQVHQIASYYWVQRVVTTDEGERSLGR
jgi:hypothetical protein